MELNLNNNSIIMIVLNAFTNDSRVLKESTSLHNAGFDVTVLALHEKNLKEFDNIQSVDIHRIKHKSRAWSKQRFFQVLKYVEFMYRVANLYKNRDIIHCNDLAALPIGVLIKKFFNKDVRIVYDAHEYEINDTPNESRIRIRIKYFMEKTLIKYADKVITVSDSIANEYVRLYGIEKPELVLNTPVFKEIEKKDIFRETLSIESNKTIFLYQGGLSKGRGIEMLLDTFKQTNDDKNVIVFMGYGSLKNLVQTAAEKYENIYFHPAVSPGILLDYTSSADFGISTIEDSCLSYRYCLPNKMFEYVMADVPVIVSNLPEMKKIVKENQIGIIVKENTVAGLTITINKAVKLDKMRLIDNLQKVKEIYNWEEQEKVLLEVYGGL